MKYQEALEPNTVSPWAGRWRGLVAMAALSVLTACGGGGGAEVVSDGLPSINQAPTQVGLIEVSSSAVGALNVSWLPASDDTTAAAAIRYQVHASTNPAFAPAANTLVFEGVGVLSANITTGLVAGSTYAVRLIAIDKGNASTVSDVLLVRVSDTVATKVFGATINNLQSTQVASVTPTALVLQAGVVAPNVGSFISSSDANGGEGYLRKVVGITQVGGVSTLQTESASINEVVSDIQISSTFKMDAVPVEIAQNAIQSGLAVVGLQQGDSVEHTFSWPQTGLRYVTGVKQQTGSTAVHQLGLVLSAGFKADNDVSLSGKWGKATGESRVEIREGAKGESKLRIFITSNDEPYNSRSAVGICKVTLGTVVASGSDGAPEKVTVTLGAFTQVATDGSRITTADQVLKFSAAASAATDKPYKVTATAYLDDAGDGCDGDDFSAAWRETIDLELEIFVTVDAFPQAEASDRTFDGSAGFSIKNNIVTTFSPKVTFDKTLSGASLTYAKMGVQASPRVDQILTIDANAQGTMDKTVEVINPRKFFKVYVTPVGIPIVVSGVLRVDMRIQGDVSGELHAVEKLSIGYDDISFGVEYRNKTFTPYHTVKPVYRLKVGGKGSAEANLTIRLLPSLEITGYEVLTGKAVLDPYMKVGAGVEGHVQLDTDVAVNTAQIDVAADADYRLTKTRLGGGVNAWLYADFHIWEKTLKVWPETAAKNNYTSYKKVELLADATIMDLPTLSAFLPTGSGTIHPQDSCAIKVRANAVNVPNPLHAFFPSLDASYITWQRWTAPLIVQQLGVPSASYGFLPDPNGEDGVFWARMTKPGTYTVRVGGYSNWGNWARQYYEIQIDATDANANGIPNWWEARYGLTGSGVAIATADPDGDGQTNVQEWQQCSDPKVSFVLGNVNATPTSLTVLDSVSVWVSDAYQTIKSVVWNFGADIAVQTATVANSLSAAVSQAFSTVGTKTITATYKDAVGNVLGQATTTVVVTAAAIPTATITDALSDTATQPGSISSGGSTEDTTPTLSGTINKTLSSGQKVNVYDGTSMFSAVAVVSGTSWTFTPVTPLIGGIHSFTVDVAQFDGTPGARSAAYTVNVLSTAVTSITPSEIIRTLTGSFEVVGRDLPTSGISVTVPGDSKASCQTPINMTVNGFGVACVFYKLGDQTLEIRQGAKVLGTATVAVKTNVTGVTWTSPSTSNSGTVKFLEDVIFTVAGVNLLADPVMGFAVQLCGVSNVETGIGSNTQRTFTCNFNNDAGAVVGQMPGTVKDAPGGQTLFGGWNVPVETAVVSGAGQLTDTGISTAQCYQLGSDALVSCTSAGAIALNANQDGMIGLDVSSPDNSDGKLGFSYSTVGSYAKTECVKDNITGLTWEGKTATGTRAGSATYTNYGDSRSGDASAYVTAVNATALCGYTDWRLPTVDELRGLVDYGVAHPGPTIDGTWFPNTLESLYWSASPWAGDTGFAWFVNFLDGGVYGSGRHNGYRVRLVR